MLARELILFAFDGGLEIENLGFKLGPHALNVTFSLGKYIFTLPQLKGMIFDEAKAFLVFLFLLWGRLFSLFRLGQLNNCFRFLGKDLKDMEPLHEVFYKAFFYLIRLIL